MDEKIKATQDEMIAAMARNESLIGALYMRYSEKFRSWVDLWATLSREESAHREWLTVLARNTGETFPVKANRFNPAVIRAFNTYMEGKIQEAAVETMTINQALATALDIENALIEKEFFTVFESDGCEVKKTFERLREETERHRSRIRAAIKSL